MFEKQIIIMNMEILMQPNVQVMAILGEQPVFANTDYRFMKYCLITDIDDGKLIFNGLTRILIFIKNNEIPLIENINDYGFLYKYYFLVPEDFDEEKMVEDIREKLRVPIDDIYLDHPESFTILTTTKCNARCFYCYELNNKKKHHMTEETAKKVGKYISNVADRNKQINLHWFGGEPLFNTKVIDIITQEVGDSGQAFTTTFTTNGYLFDKDLVLKARNIWNTTDVQITLDGTEEVYNKVKNYIYKDKINPYKKVLNNIATLLNAGIKVTIRMNIDSHNADNLILLVKELKNRFGTHPHLAMYVWPIFENEFFVRTIEEHCKIFEKIHELEETIVANNYNIGNYPNSDIIYTLCMADCGKSVVISPDGDLGVCEHFIDSNFWGHINNPTKKNFEEIKCWREYEKPLNICKNCPIYPSCIRPSKCQEMSKCDEFYKEWRIKKNIKGIIEAYNNYKLNYPREQCKLAENIN